MIRFMVLTAALMAFPMMAATPVGSLWTDDFPAAQVEAKKLKRPILLNFTGSDWCGWCKKLQREVFSKPEFTNYAAKNLVLVTVDFPHGIKQSPALIRQNAELSEKYKVEAYPTILLVDASGKVLAQTGYQSGGAAAYVKHLRKLLAR